MSLSIFSIAYTRAGTRISERKFFGISQRKSSIFFRDERSNIWLKLHRREYLISRPARVRRLEQVYRLYIHRELYGPLDGVMSHFFCISLFKSCNGHVWDERNFFFLS